MSYREMQEYGMEAEAWEGWIACVWLPEFSVREERVRRPGLPAMLALVGAEAGQRTVVIRACSPAARAAGLAVGQPAHAIPQKCPQAAVLPFDFAHYERRFLELLAALDTLTPLVEPRMLEAFYLGLRGLERLDCGNPEPVARAVQEVIPIAYSPRVGLARNKFVAWAAACSATEQRPVVVPHEAREVFLREAPSSLLPAPQRVHARLDALGLRTLGRIARLPRSALLAQFGWVGERLHRLACGEDPEPLQPSLPPPQIRESMAFPMTAPTVADFDLALHELLLRAWTRPERARRAVRQLRLLAQLESGDVWERTLTLRRPLETAEAVFAEVRRRLGGEGAGGRPAGAVTDLCLELTALAARVDSQPLLLQEEHLHRRERLALELEQLRTRMQLRKGAAAGLPVYRIVEVEPWSRLPEKRHALLSYDP